MNEDSLLTADELAERLRVQPGTVRQWSRADSGREAVAQGRSLRSGGGDRSPDPTAGLFGGAPSCRAAFASRDRQDSTGGGQIRSNLGAEIWKRPDRCRTLSWPRWANDRDSRKRR